MAMVLGEATLYVGEGVVAEDLSMKAQGISMDYYTSSAAREEKGPLSSRDGHNLTISCGLDAQICKIMRDISCSNSNTWNTPYRLLC